MAILGVSGRTKIITVMADDDIHVCAFPVSDSVKFEGREKDLLSFARLELVACRHVYVCNALRYYGYSTEGRRCEHKLKNLLALAALQLRGVSVEDSREVQTLDQLYRLYWQQETSLLEMGFQIADVHTARIAWIKHLVTWY